VKLAELFDPDRPTGELAETVTYPECQRGRMDDNYAHRFTDAEVPAAGQTYIYCRRCGLVQKLEPKP
jgi:hypothetical protein